MRCLILLLAICLLCFSPIAAQDDGEFINLDAPAPPAPAVVPAEPATTTQPQISTTQENNIPVTQPADTTTTTTTTEDTPGEQANNNNDAPAPATDVPATQAAPVTADPATTATPTPVKRKCKPSTTSATKETVEQGTAHANLAGFLPLNSLIFGGNQFTQQLSNTQFNNGLVQGSIFNTPASQTNGVLFSPVQSPTLNLGNNVLGNQVFGGGRLNVFQGNLAPQFQGPAAAVGLPGTGFLTFSAVNCDLNPDDPSCCIPDTESTTPTIVGATDDNTVTSGTAKVNGDDDDEVFFPVFRANPFVTVPTVGFNPGVNVLQNNGQTAGNFFTNNFNAVNQLSTTVTGLIQNNQLFNTFNNGFTNLLNGANNVNGNNNANVVTNLNNIANANFGAQMNANVLPDVAKSFNQAFNGALATPVPTLVNVGAGFQITGFQTVKVFSTEDCAIPGSCDALKQSTQASNTLKGPTPITPVLSFNDDISIISLIVCLSILSGLFSGASALLVYRESKHVNSCPVQRRSLSQKV